MPVNLIEIVAAMGIATVTLSLLQFQVQREHQQPQSPIYGDDHCLIGDSHVQRIQDERVLFSAAEVKFYETCIAV